jgi:autotransporter-associated beta strand protein
MGYSAGVSGYTGNQFMNLSGNAVLNSTATGTGDTNYVSESSGSVATLNISNTAQLNTSTYLIVGRNSGATGTVIQSGGRVNTATDLRIGQAGAGTYNQTGGSVVGVYLRLGVESTGVGAYNISGGTSTFSGTGSEADIGSIGTGTLDVSGTGVITQANTYLGCSYWTINPTSVADGGTGNIIVSGNGSLTITGTIIGSSNTGTGNVTLNGGTLTTNSIGKSALPGTGGTLNIYFNGGVLKAGVSDNPSGGTYFLTGLTSAKVQKNLLSGSGGAIIDTNNCNVTINQILAEDSSYTGGGLTKQGLGTLTIIQNATYTGNTTVNTGILDMLDIKTPNAAVSVAANAELTASSVVADTLTIGAGGTVIIKALSGGPGSSSSLSPVPEPSTLVLLAMAALATLVAARRKK